MGLENHLGTRRRIGYDSESMFVGMQKNTSGERIQVYVNPDEGQAFARARRNMLPLIGMAGTGIIGSGWSRNRIAGVARLVDAYGRAVEENQSSSRRRFVRAAVAAGGLAGLVGCGDDGSGITKPTPPDDDTPKPDPVAPIPVISGLSEVSIPRLGGEAEISLSGADTQGRVTRYEWKGTIPDTNIEGILSLGNEVTATHRTSRPGTIIFDLTAYNSWASNTVTHEVRITPPDLPEQAYDLPIVFMDKIEVNDQDVSAIFVANSKTGGAAVKLFSTPLIHTSRVNWRPGGEGIVFTLGYPRTKRSVWEYSLETGNFNELSNNRSGLAWQASVSPNGELIAYMDDSRAPNRSYDEGAIMSVDGSGQFYLCGDSPNDSFAGKSPSWEHTSERVAFGNVRYDITGRLDQGQDWDRRIGVFGDLLSGNPSRDYHIPSEEQLENLWATGDFDISREYFFETLTMGFNGLAWSPDGRIVYDMQFGIIPNNYQLLVLSNVDGSGNIDVLATSEGEDFNVEFFLPHSPTWLPDSMDIVFSGFSYFEKKLYRVNPDTKYVDSFGSTNNKPVNASLYD